jgi:hypothetical protein
MKGTRIGIAGKNAAVWIILGILGWLALGSLLRDLARPVGARESRSLPASMPLIQVTKADLDAIRTGMTYEQVRGMIGVAGEEQSRSDLGGYRTIMYGWKNANGSNMNAMFQNNQLVSKAQFGLP